MKIHIWWGTVGDVGLKNVEEFSFDEQISRETRNNGLSRAYLFSRVCLAFVRSFLKIHLHIS